MSTADFETRAPTRSHGTGRTAGRRRAARTTFAAVAIAAGAIGMTACDPLPTSCTANWIGPDGGDFADPTSWDIGDVPGTLDMACSSAGSSIVLRDSRSIAIGAFDGALTIEAAGTLTTRGGTTDIADLEQHGTLAGTGSYIIDHLDWQGGSAIGQGLVRIGSGATSTISGDIVLGGSRLLGVFGETSWTGGTIRVCDDSAVSVFGEGSLAASNPTGAITTTGCATVGDVAMSVRLGGTLTVHEDLAITTPFLNLATTRISCGATLEVVSYEQPAEATTALTDVVCGSTLRVAGGEGTLQLDGGVLAGSGYVDAHVVGSGAINPGDPLVPGSVDYLLILGTYTATAGATLPFEIAGPELADQDTLYVTGAADVTAATYAPQVLSPFVPEAGQTFSPLSADGVAGPFATFTPPAGFGLTWDLEYTDLDITLTAST